MHSLRNAIEIVKDKMQRGLINACQANVELVQMVGIKVVSVSMQKELRKSLNDAVKAGELGHIKKSKLKPEVYHHVNARARALEEQDRIFRNNLERISKIYTN